MKKYKVVRASGNPVNNDHIDKFHNEFKTFYDRLMIKLKVKENELLEQDKAEKIQVLLQRREARLLKKYPNVEYWPFLTSKKALDAVRQHGPIMLATDRETKELTYVIFDIPV